MPDKRKVRNKVLLRLLGHPVVLAPAVLGFSLGTWFWAFAGRPAFGVFALLAGCLTAGGAYLTRVLFDQGRMAGQVMAEHEMQQRAAWESRLDALDQRLVQADQDPRPETALRDLRALLRPSSKSHNSAATSILPPCSRSAHACNSSSSSRCMPSSRR
jgi:hypothetical protein